MSKKKILTEYKCVDEDQIMHDKEASVFARDKMRFFFSSILHSLY